MKIFNHILVFGDNHGHWNVFPDMIRKYKLTNCAIIVAGDFGIGFELMVREVKQLSWLSRRLKHTNSVLYAIRGNHDNPEYFTGRFDTDNVKLLPDYTVLNINNLNILCVGGAYSIDRTWRKSYFNPKENSTKSNNIAANDYWITEPFIYDHDKVMSMKNIDVVVTHSAPEICPPYIKIGIENFAEKDSKIMEDCRIERAQLFQMYDNLSYNGNNITKWYYGHYHCHYKTPYNGTDFIGLDIDEFEEIR